MRVAFVRHDSGTQITGSLTRPSQLGSARWVGIGAGGGLLAHIYSPAEREEGAEQRDEGSGGGDGEVRVGRRSPLLQLTGECFFFFFKWVQPGACCLLEEYLRVQLAEMIRLHSRGADEDRWVLLITNNCWSRLSVAQSKRATVTSHMSLINPVVFVKGTESGTCYVNKMTGK